MKSPMLFPLEEETVAIDDVYLLSKRIDSDDELYDDELSASEEGFLLGYHAA